MFEEQFTNNCVILIWFKDSITNVKVLIECCSNYTDVRQSFQLTLILECNPFNDVVIFKIGCCHRPILDQWRYGHLRNVSLNLKNQKKIMNPKIVSVTPILVLFNSMHWNKQHKRVPLFFLISYTTPFFIWSNYKWVLELPSNLWYKSQLRG